MAKLVGSKVAFVTAVAIAAEGEVATFDGIPLVAYWHCVWQRASSILWFVHPAGGHGSGTLLFVERLFGLARVKYTVHKVVSIAGPSGFSGLWLRVC